MHINPRIIGQRVGDSHGPLLIILAQMHGNEPAGYLAAKELFEAIDLEYSINPSFNFKGKIIALQGNMPAAVKGERYIVKDLNRNWTADTLARIANAQSDADLDAEDIQIKELVATIQHIIAEYASEQVVVLDLHTTTAEGGIFSIPSQENYSRYLALSMHAPVLHGFLSGLAGTSLHFFNKEYFPNINITAVCFEAGQHNSPESPKLAMSAIINCFKAMGGFYKEHIEMRHEELLKERAKYLPKEGHLVYTYAIAKDEKFEMRKDKIYKNFDPIEKGELLAYNQHGAIYAPYKGYILMPLYQKLGSDGFFIIAEIQADDANKKTHTAHQTAAF